MAKTLVRAVGIDLGTTYACVGVCKDDGEVKIIKTIPCFVAFTETKRLVGTAAREEFRNHSHNNFVSDAKRLMGQKFEDSSVQRDAQKWTFKVVEGENGRPMYKVNYCHRERTYTPEDITSMVLHKLKKYAEDYLGRPVTKAVITVPAHFNSKQRKATRDAASKANLKVLCLLDDPTATAIAYGTLNNTNNDKMNVLVFDFGGGTLEVSIFCMEGKEFSLKAKVGDIRLGGLSLTNRMVYHFIDEFKKKYQKDILKDRLAFKRLWKRSEEAKKTLSSAQVAGIDVPNLCGRIHFRSTITRQNFEKINSDYFTKSKGLVIKCLEDAKMDKRDIDKVLLVGGSTRIQKVRKILESFFDPNKFSKNINRNEAVAQGAAIRAARESKRAPRRRPRRRQGNFIIRSVGDVREKYISLIKYNKDMLKIQGKTDPRYTEFVAEFLKHTKHWMKSNPKATTKEIKDRINILKIVCTYIDPKVINQYHNYKSRRTKAVSETHFNHSAGHKFKWTEKAKGKYQCEVCKQHGNGPRYSCEFCSSFYLHENCINVVPRAKHELTDCIFELCTKQVLHNKRTRKCNACRDAIKGMFYWCEGEDIALHPVCFNLKSKISIDNVEFKLTVEGSCKLCTVCGNVNPESTVSSFPRGWSFESKVERCRIHVYCAIDIFQRCMEIKETTGNQLDVKKFVRALCKGKGNSVSKLMKTTTHLLQFLDIVLSFTVGPIPLFTCLGSLLANL